MQALRHSKVKLTWDDDDPTRNQLTRRRITRKEMEEADFKAYLASSGSEESDDEGEGKSASRDRLRSLLLGGGNDLPEGWNDGEGRDEGGRDVDMEVTFTPGLSSLKEDKDETTLEKYQRKLRDKRKKKKEQSEKPADNEKDTVEDDFFAAASDDEENRLASSIKKSGKEKKLVKESKPKDIATEEDLSRLVASSATEPRHFNLKSVIKAEKLKGKKLRKGKKNKLDEAELQEDFSINVDDDRFTAVHDDNDFAIDPSNPQ